MLRLSSPLLTYLQLWLTRQMWLIVALLLVMSLVSMRSVDVCRLAVTIGVLATCLMFCMTMAPFLTWTLVLRCPSLRMRTKWPLKIALATMLMFLVIAPSVANRVRTLAGKVGHGVAARLIVWGWWFRTLSLTALLLMPRRVLVLLSPVSIVLTALVWICPVATCLFETVLVIRKALVLTWLGSILQRALRRCLMLCMMTAPALVFLTLVFTWIR